MKKQGSLGIVSIIGPGLIGSSIGLGLKENKLAGLVIGVGHRDASLEKALAICSIDSATKDMKKGVREADIVIICTSVELIPGIAKKIIPWMKSSSILTDVGSTKRYIVDEIMAIDAGSNGSGVEFIGGHPLAGSEKRGVEAARPDLFQGATCILTPTGRSSNRSLHSESHRARATVKGMWEALGAKVKFLSPEEHDLLMAFISHLPQLVATSLVNTLHPNQLALTARGFKDVTRIASSDPSIWRGILLQNRESLLKAITEFQKEIVFIKKILQESDSKQLLTRLKKAKDRRDKLLDKKPYAVQN